MITTWYDKDCALLEGTRDVEVIGEAGTGYEAVERVAELVPDVIVMDLSMPQLDGVQAASRSWI